jgi:hypothetical protein
LGAGLDSGLSALGGGFDSGFKSGLPGLDITIVVLLFWFPPPGADPGKAWKIVEQALKMKAHWRPLNSPKVGALHTACRQGIPDWPLQKVLTFAHADAVQFCSRMAERPCTLRIPSFAPGGAARTLYDFLPYEAWPHQDGPFIRLKDICPE